ncbi:hypothetical protein [Metabacillus indicus]|nr:hypothetical protein [Metabacillus indicus]
MNYKLHCLEAVRDDIGEKRYRTSLIQVIANYYEEAYGGKKVNKSSMLTFINLMLTSRGLEEISYSYVKKLVA